MNHLYTNVFYYNYPNREPLQPPDPTPGGPRTLTLVTGTQWSDNGANHEVVDVGFYTVIVSRFSFLVSLPLGSGCGWRVREIFAVRSFGSTSFNSVRICSNIIHGSRISG